MNTPSITTIFSLSGPGVQHRGDADEPHHAAWPWLDGHVAPRRREGAHGHAAHGARWPGTGNSLLFTLSQLSCCCDQMFYMPLLPFHWVQSKRHWLWFSTKTCSCYSTKTHINSKFNLKMRIMLSRSTWVFVE